MVKFNLISEIIKQRRAVYPESYLEKDISDELIMKILENGNWAPTHKKTEPWRFKVFKNDSKVRLGEFLAENYKKLTPEENFSPLKYQKTIGKADKSACIIAICMQRDPEKSLPRWEEEAAVACAVQNIWLSCAALGIGAYWSTPGAIHYFQELMPLNDGEVCIGFFYMGYMKEGDYKSQRRPIEEKVKFI